MAAERIVSLVPSLTETLFALGVGKRIVGRGRGSEISTWYGPGMASSLTQVSALLRF